MKDEKWVLPSKEAYNAGLSNILRHDDDEIDLRKGELNKECRLLAESDLTASLDLLEKLVDILQANQFYQTAKEIESYLQTFRK